MSLSPLCAFRPCPCPLCALCPCAFFVLNAHASLPCPLCALRPYPCPLCALCPCAFFLLNARASLPCPLCIVSLCILCPQCTCVLALSSMCIVSLCILCPQCTCVFALSSMCNASRLGNNNVHAPEQKLQTTDFSQAIRYNVPFRYGVSLPS